MVAALCRAMTVASVRPGGHRAEEAEPHTGQEQDQRADGQRVASRQNGVHHAGIIRLGQKECKSPQTESLLASSRKV